MQSRRPDPAASLLLACCAVLACTALPAVAATLHVARTATDEKLQAASVAERGAEQGATDTPASETEPDLLFESVGAALAAASPGDTIVVSPGEYRENIIVDRPVTLTGKEGASIVGLGQGDVVHVAADDVTLRGFAISGSGNDMLHSDAGIKISGARAVVAENRIHDNLFGVYLRRCSDAVIEGNEIRGRAEVDMGRRGAGIHFYDSHHNTVRGNRVRDVRDGVYFDHSDFNHVVRNHFSDLRYGVHYMYCEDNKFADNVFRDSVGGAAVMYTERVEFTGNQILNNRAGHNAFGLLFKDALESSAVGNVVVNSVNGIVIDNSHGIEIRGNLVAHNDVGVLLYASALEAKFGGNDFVENLSILRTVGRADADWSPNGLGNYYSSFSGYDLDEDGVGDVPYRLQDAFEYLEGSRPLLRLFLNSAAADALAAAERSFPLVPSSEERDLAPRMKPVSGVRVTYRYRGTRPTASRVMLAGVPLLALAASGCAAWRFSR